MIDDCGQSSANLAEAVSRFTRDGHNPEVVYRQIAGHGMTIAPFHGEDATLAAGLVPLTRAFGLSLGNRACLALALRHSITAITADHAWSKIDLPIPVRVIRPATPS